MKGNIIVGQSGGPTAAINSSLAGVYRTAKDRGAEKVYGMLHGIQGLMQERYIDLSAFITNELDAELLKRTPAAFLGSCRYKLPEIHEDRDVYEKIFKILDKLNIEAFIYIGGNDSMDTIKKLSDYAIVTGHPTRFVGCPKTIDNDLALTDHTPGYGSAAKYIGTSVKEIIRDSFCLEYKNGLVSIVEIMGRNAGWLTGAAALAKGEDCSGPDLIYLPELPFDIETFGNKVKELLEQKPSVVVAISEGIRLADGRYVCELGQSIDFVDAFGHKQLSGTANYLASYIAGEIGCKTRAIELSSLQRSASHCASRVDILEAYQVGGAAVKAADEGDSGKMVVLKRLSDDPYQSGTEVKDVHKIANDEKLVPREWLNEEGTYVTDEFVNYVRPLIQGDVSPIMVDGIPRHLFRPY
ncbi:6-phosphofructokinase [Faecalicatena acetigenes]|uniref:Pyrophosphate--fructose 6-phosphate 1-phosphotransferase n=1 Tax=Faecalicatena acetigenes TaxID=2981790 RepID=A0ABT2TBK6_9FIRM|nr:MULTISPECIES: 6-phosphofructokinase [Lachnospiraceae]MCU6747653.1 6-phosphofructokinase [Faecalicatena acetigenes]SCI02296.1 Pyrophosphate--fructose 6-phosphate 1-phosphotransferase [uncultured Clostridium sp.]